MVSHILVLDGFTYSCFRWFHTFLFWVVSHILVLGGFPYSCFRWFHTFLFWVVSEFYYFRSSLDIFSTNTTVSEETVVGFTECEPVKADPHERSPVRGQRPVEMQSGQ